MVAQGITVPPVRGPKAGINWVSIGNVLVIYVQKNKSTFERVSLLRFEMSFKGGDHLRGDVGSFLGCEYSYPLVQVRWYHAVELRCIHGRCLVHEGGRSLLLASPGLTVHGHSITSRSHRA